MFITNQQFYHYLSQYKYNKQIKVRKDLNLLKLKSLNML